MNTGGSRESLWVHDEHGVSEADQLVHDGNGFMLKTGTMKQKKNQWVHNENGVSEAEKANGFMIKTGSVEQRKSMGS